MRDAQKYLKNFKQLIHQDLKNQIIKSYLFGSYARGKINKNSDIDILLVAKNKKRVSDKVGDFVIDTLMKNGPYFSVKIFEKRKYNELNRANTFFMRHLKRDAKSL